MFPTSLRIPRLNLRLKLGIGILLVFVLGSFTLPLFTSVDPSEQGTYPKALPMAWQHPLGTNSQGQDIFWLLVFAVRNSLLLGIVVSIGITLIATLVGLSAGYIGGWYERVVLMVMDSFIAIPVFPILIVLGTLVRGQTSFAILGAVLIVFGWAWGSRT